MNIYYVYQLVDPRTNQIFYVGKGKGNRAYSHASGKDGNRNPHKDRVIQKILTQNLKPIVEFVHLDLDEDTAYRLEERLIEQFGLENLTNICKDANPPRKVGAENGFFGKTHTAETKQRLGQVNLGKDIKTVEGKEAISRRQKEIWADPVEREKRIENLKGRKGEKRSDAAKESYRKSAAERDSKMTPEARSQRTMAGVETKRIKYQGLQRQRYIDPEGKIKYRWVPSIDQEAAGLPGFCP